MNIEDIKVGETYNVRVKVIGIRADGVDAIYADAEGIAGLHIGERRVGILRPIITENGTKNTETAPKYDPNRLFRKGDKVRVVEEINGRIPPLCGDIEAGNVYTVSDNEDGGDVMLEVNGKYDCIDWYWLELVTPVEELEPWVLDEGDPHFWGIVKTAGKFPVMLPRDYYTKEAAEAECDRLNAEYRKEKE